jgi:hypothetical protein
MLDRPEAQLGLRSAPGPAQLVAQPRQHRRGALACGPWPSSAQRQGTAARRRFLDDGAASGKTKSTGVVSRSRRID